MVDGLHLAGEDEQGRGSEPSSQMRFSFWISIHRSMLLAVVAGVARRRTSAATVSLTSAPLLPAPHPSPRRRPPSLPPTRATARPSCSPRVAMGTATGRPASTAPFRGSASPPKARFICFVDSLAKLRPQAVMATTQVLFHRFYCKKSFVRFSAKRVAASCVWLAGKLEESLRKSEHIIFVFHRMECRRQNWPIEYLDVFSKKYSEPRHDLIGTERHLLKEMGFICHVEHPHKFISNYLVTLEAPELTQEAWNLANDRLEETACGTGDHCADCRGLC